MRIESRLSHILGAKRLKMSEVARRTGIGKTTLLRLYHDRAEGIRFDVLAKLCRFLNCQPGDLLVCVTDEEEGEDSEGKRGNQDAAGRRLVPGGTEGEPPAV
ncbi:MAG: helix-turn-helix domain-containing protein [Desulfotomaculales bacterium]